MKYYIKKNNLMQTAKQMCRKVDEKFLRKCETIFPLPKEFEILYTEPSVNPINGDSWYPCIYFTLGTPNRYDKQSKSPNPHDKLLLTMPSIIKDNKLILGMRMSISNLHNMDLVTRKIGITPTKTWLEDNNSKFIPKTCPYEKIKKQFSVAIKRGEVKHNKIYGDKK